jgi:hypothetical protein
MTSTSNSLYFVQHVELPAPLLNRTFDFERYLGRAAEPRRLPNHPPTVLVSAPRRRGAAHRKTLCLVTGNHGVHGPWRPSIPSRAGISLPSIDDAALPRLVGRRCYADRALNGACRA